MNLPLVSKLPNGLALVLHPRSEVRSVSVSLWISRGSRHEPADIAGITHFIEHLLFKGTTRHDWVALSREMNLQGGLWNACTFIDWVKVHTRVVQGDLGPALELLRDMVWDSTFPPEEVERERGVILEEIAQTEDAPEDLCLERGIEALFHAHPVGRPVIGTVDTVAGMSRDVLVQYWRGLLDPSRMVLSIAGAIDPAACAAEAARLFGSQATVSPAPDPAALAPTTRGGRLPIERDLEQVHFCMCSAGPRRGHPLRFAHAMHDAILGAGMGSRLFNEVRERRGLAYTIGSSLQPLAGTGYAFIYGSTSPRHLEEVLSVSWSQLEALASDGPTDDEVATARRMLERGFLLSLESSEYLVSRNGERALYGEPHMRDEEVLAAIQAVTSGQIREAAQEWLATGEPLVSLVGPLKA